ncbi:MAG TPA: IPTL-CTERM sorting domain-containing protein, partial [Thermoanaerobaculia bacterium]|nr:IPTL-CTERM sorting domain-containing protein [Thermoanaerobaculia bacterium]
VDTLPAGSTFVSASGTGWVCNNVSGTVTCTVASLPLGAAPVINLTFNAPPVVTAGTLSNTATVSSATTDPTPANNSSTKTVPILPGNQIPALSTWMLGLLAAALGFVALARRT